MRFSSRTLEVPVENLVGEEGMGFRYIIDGWNAERILIAAEAVGDGHWFVDRASRYAGERQVFGRPIGANQGIQFPIAQAYAHIEAADLVRYHAASKFDRGERLRRRSQHGQAAGLGSLVGGGQRLYDHPRRLRIVGGLRHRAQVSRDPAADHRAGEQQFWCWPTWGSTCWACRGPIEGGGTRFHPGLVSRGSGAGLAAATGWRSRRQDAFMDLQRSWMFVPGHRQRMIDKALGLDADALMLDIEDGVAPAEKDQARRLIGEALGRERGPREPLRYVRINAIGHQRMADDLAAVLRPGLDGLVLPKVESPEEIATVESLVAEHEAARGTAVKLLVAIESPRGLLAAPAIAACSSRVVGLMFGAEDFGRELGLPTFPRGGGAGSPLRALGARGGGRFGPCPRRWTAFWVDLQDPEGLARFALQSRRLGFSGMSSIHPSQIAPINTAFSPGPEEIDYARKVIEAYEEAAARGDGSVAFGGQLIDRPDHRAGAPDPAACPRPWPTRPNEGVPFRGFASVPAERDTRCRGGFQTRPRPGSPETPARNMRSTRPMPKVENAENVRCLTATNPRVHDPPGQQPVPPGPQGDHRHRRPLSARMPTSTGCWPRWKRWAGTGSPGSC